MPGSLLAELPARQAAEFLIHQGQQGIYDGTVAAAQVGQQNGDLGLGHALAWKASAEDCIGRAPV
jgi:hypothetical protein